MLSTVGRRVAVERGEVEDSAVSVATGAVTLEEMAAWFEDNSRPI